MYTDVKDLQILATNLTNFATTHSLTEETHALDAGWRVDWIDLWFFFVQLISLEH